MISDRRRTDVTVVESSTAYTGAVWAVIRDVINFRGKHLTRDFVQHMGAVGVVAVNDKDEILLISQYRHAVGYDLVEIPAGLLDSISEEPLAAAQRELSEETGYAATKWQVLVDLCTTPGSSSESLRIFLASGVSENEWQTDSLRDEEQEIVRQWVTLETCLQAIFDGRMSSPTSVLGVLAYAASKGRDLRSTDSAWPMREWAVETNRIFVPPAS